MGNTSLSMSCALYSVHWVTLCSLVHTVHLVTLYTVFHESINEHRLQCNEESWSLEGQETCVLCCVQYTVQCTVHCAVYTTLCSVLYTVQCVHWSQCTLYCTLLTLYCTVCALVTLVRVHTGYTVHWTLYTLFNRTLATLFPGWTLYTLYTLG